MNWTIIRKRKWYVSRELDTEQISEKETEVVDNAGDQNVKMWSLKYFFGFNWEE